MSHFKKIAILVTVISVTGIATAVVGRTTAGQPAVQELAQIQAVDDRVQTVLSRQGPDPRDASTPKKDQRPTAIESKLDAVVSLKVDNQPLHEAIFVLTNETGVNIVLDPKALSEAGLTSASPVSLSVKKVKLRTVLKLLLRPLGLTYRLEDEVVLITRGEAMETGGKATYPRTYYVGDLLPAPPDSAANRHGAPIGRAGED